MARQVASSEPAATQVWDTVENLGVAAEMSPQVVSSEPAATQVLAVTVEMVGVTALVAAVHDIHTEFMASHLGVAAEMAPQVVSSEPAATQVLDTVEILGVAAEMARQVASLEPAATQVLDTVENLGVAAEMAAQVSSAIVVQDLAPIAERSTCWTVDARLHEAAAERNS